MNPTDYEEEAAYSLVAYASDLLHPDINEEDIDAAIVGMIATALEIAHGRHLKPLEEIFHAPN